MKKSILGGMTGAALCAALAAQTGLTGIAVAAGQPAPAAPARPAASSAAPSTMAMGSSPAMTPQDMIKHRTTPAMRKQAADNAAKKGLVVASKGIETKGWKYVAPKRTAATAAKIKAVSQAIARTTAVAPKATGAAVIGPKVAAMAAAAAVPTVPDYNGTTPNYANSPLPTVDQATNTVVSGGIRKFVDELPGLGAANANDLGQFIPVAVPDTTTYPGSDYYEIAVTQGQVQLHKDLPPTTIRSYVQLNKGTDSSGQNTIEPAKLQYLGPEVVAQKGRPVRVKFVNQLPTGSGGDLFLPTDSTMMGAGTGPDGVNSYTQNRANLHLHGGLTPWISDGTPNQWTTPAGENTPYPKGVSVSYVPDMWFDKDGNAVPKGTPGATNNPGPGAMTFFYTNQQSARLMWYHDHSLGITRLNVYSGEAALYELHDSVEKDLVAKGLLPSTEVPLIIQDKTFVPDAAQLSAEDPTWDTTKWGTKGNLWFPHVYVPNQNPYDLSGANAMGRWDYGPWFWPPYTGLKNGEIANPLYNPTSTDPTVANEPPMIPGIPATSLTPEAFMDTPVVNGTAYPYMKVDRKAYRFRILNASNDRTWNLQLYYAKSNETMWNSDGTLNKADAGEVPMVSAVKTSGFPATWPSDGRDGGVPDPAAAGPSMIQVGNDGGLLPAPVTLPNQPVDYTYNRRDITVLNVSSKTLMLAPAERADVVVDFSQVPAGSQLILYNDGPAPIPAFDPRYDYYTGDPDQTTTGGAPTTQPGYGPNTRTIMQFQVNADTAVTPPAAFDPAPLQAALTSSYTAADGTVSTSGYLADQHAPIVPQAAYSAVTGKQLPTTYSTIQATSLTFNQLSDGSSVNVPMQPKAIQELFETNYGRMNATLGAELPNTNANVQTTLPLGFAEPATEIMSPSDLGKPIGTLNDGTQIWKITHNGVDTHSIHFHLFDVQLINRVGWDGAVRLPDPNEIGWKDTVRMNPLEDAIVAMRPVAPDLPFKIGDSIRPIDPTMPIGAPISTFDIKTGQAITVQEQPHQLRLGVRLALPHPRARGERHDAADHLRGVSGPADVLRGPLRQQRRERAELAGRNRWPDPHQLRDPAGRRRVVLPEPAHLRSDRPGSGHHQLDRRRGHSGQHVLLPDPVREQDQLLGLVERRHRPGDPAHAQDPDRVAGRCAHSGRRRRDRAQHAHLDRGGGRRNADRVRGAPGYRPGLHHQRAGHGRRRGNQLHRFRFGAGRTVLLHGPIHHAAADLGVVERGHHGHRCSVEPDGNREHGVAADGDAQLAECGRCRQVLRATVDDGRVHRTGDAGRLADQHAVHRHDCCRRYRVLVPGHRGHGHRWHRSEPARRAHHAGHLAGRGQRARRQRESRSDHAELDGSAVGDGLHRDPQPGVRRSRHQDGVRDEHLLRHGGHRRGRGGVHLHGDAGAGQRERRRHTGRHRPGRLQPAHRTHRGERDGHRRTHRFGDGGAELVAGHLRSGRHRLHRATGDEHRLHRRRDLGRGEHGGVDHDRRPGPQHGVLLPGDRQQHPGVGHQHDGQRDHTEVVTAP